MITVDVIDKGFNKKIHKAIKTFNNLSDFFKEISADWHRTNEIELFKGRSGAGQWQGLSETLKQKALPEKQRYKYRKLTKLGKVPVMQGEDKRIRDGLTKTRSQYSVNKITSKNLIMGIENIPYAETHQKGLKVKTRYGSFKMPKRPFIFNEETGTKNFHLMIKRWKRMFESYYKGRLRGMGA